MTDPKTPPAPTPRIDYGVPAIAFLVAAAIAICGVLDYQARVIEQVSKPRIAVPDKRRICFIATSSAGTGTVTVTTKPFVEEF